MENQSSTGNEIPTVFSCNAKQLMGITHHACGESTRGVVIVVGGPQYRVGSHRQFLILARGLASQGIPVFRFDCRGMGDSEGEFPGFENISDDINAAIDAFCEQHSALTEVVIWGLCDGASAASFYGYKDKRVSGLVLVNPWIRTDKGEAKAYLKHYYLSRLLNKAFWAKVFSGKFEFAGSARSLIGICKATLRTSTVSTTEISTDSSSPASKDDADSSLALPERFYQGVKNFTKPILLLTSGNDLTAAEFLDVIHSDKRWLKLARRDTFENQTLPEADHTFSSRVSMDWVIQQTVSWFKALD